MPLQGWGKYPAMETPTTWYDDGATGGRIKEYRVLKVCPNAEAALTLLRRVGSIVKPIMAKHGWHLPQLVEFLPRDERLLGLNVNHGQKICLRLRRNKDSTDLFAEDMVVETMLHELTHNVRGPHDEIFDQQLKELTEEWYELRRKGRADGEGILSAGRSVGGSRAPGSRADAREAAARAAEMRAQRGTGGRLGGSWTSNVIVTAEDRRRVAAEAADARARQATRHRQENLKRGGGCPSSQGELEAASAEQQAQEAKETLKGVEVVTLLEDAHEKSSAPSSGLSSNAASESQGNPERKFKTPQYVELSDDEEPLRPLSTNGEASSPSLIASKRAPSGQPNSGAFVLDRGPPQSSQERWSCQVCTLLNHPVSKSCDACQAARPGAVQLRKPLQQSNADWNCARCGYLMAGDKADFWVCEICHGMRPS
ncbi:WLM-domain-containing protein [Ceraceosorus guamensis]|uniref:WLM-domain-containing protein n=1 Tax=Ceraceosorus guamensis TaxID=1522189 RepID=A0A316W7K2_9BASI|nr:WLM-domain-containing protein [Ceraceosorus guamensis]PWN45802.1 WLM-domain-containing protein [Ceraceosorus guamensis]